MAGRGTRGRAHLARSAALVGVVLVVSGCARAGFEGLDHGLDRSGPHPTDTRVGAEPSTGDRHASPDHDRAGCTWGPFSGAAPVTEVNGGNLDWEPAIAADGLTLYFTSDRGGSSDIWVATRPAASASFSTPIPLAAVNSSGEEGNPSISADGREIYLSRVVSLKPQLFVTRRDTASDAFPAPVALEGITGCANGPDIAHDGLSLYYTDCSGAVPSIHLATRSSPGQPFVDQRVVDEVGDGGWPSLSADGLELFFESDRSGVLRIYVARRQSTADHFGTPTLVKEIDTLRGTEDAELSADGRTLYYAVSPTDNTREIRRATRACAP